MQKDQDAKECKLAILEKQICLEYEEIEKEKSVYQLINGNRIMIKYSKIDKNKSYFFGITKSKVERLITEKLFILLACDAQTERYVIVLPATYILKFLQNIKTAKDKDWKLTLSKNEDVFILSDRPKKNTKEVSDYLNRFDLINDEFANSNEQDAFSEEIIEEDKYYEGAIKQIKINRYERDLEARNKCIAHYGLSCCICGFKFEDKYGSIGKGFIHIHHLKPLSEIGYEYELDPIQDLRPVCPNCHAIIHRRRPPYSIEEILKVLNRSQ